LNLCLSGLMTFNFINSIEKIIWNLIVVLYIFNQIKKNLRHFLAQHFGLKTLVCHLTEIFSFHPHNFFVLRISLFASSFKLRNTFFEIFFCLKYKFWNIFFKFFDKFKLKKLRKIGILSRPAHTILMILHGQLYCMLHNTFDAILLVLLVLS
jgi:hypothetical protein